MSIGLVMFGKGLVIGLFAVFATWWAAFRKRRTERGLPLKQNRNGVYEVSDWAAKAEWLAYRLWHGLLIATVAWWAILLGIWLLRGDEGLRAHFVWLLF